MNAAEPYQDTFYLDPVLYTGRPVDVLGRLSKEIRTYDLLDRLGITYPVSYTHLNIIISNILLYFRYNTNIIISNN